jgi:serine/threonine protein kinase
MISKENDLSSIKIIDFGLSAQHFNYLSNNDYCGTFIYMAPEQIEKKLYYYSVDIWSIGILMYMLLNNGKHPFYHKDDKKEDFIKKIKLAKLHFINKISYMAKNLMHKLCEPNPSWRYSANLAIKHPWITRNPHDDIPLTFNEILNRNNNKKNAHALIMISIFLNYVKKTFPYNTFNNSNNFDNTNNNIDNFGEFIKRKNTKTKLFKISKEYINKCNLISKKEKERYQKIREKCLEVMSTDEEDSFEKKNNNNNIINNIISLKKINKSSEKYISPQKKYYAEESDYEYSNRFLKYNNKKALNKKKIINLNNNVFVRDNQNSNIKDKNKSNNIHLLSMGNKSKEKTNNENTSKEMSTKKINRNINSNKNIINNNNIVNNKINNRNLNSNKNSINQAKTKSKSISKFFINKNISNEAINEQNEIIREQESKEITPKKSKRFSIYKSSKVNKYKINTNLPYVSTLGTQLKETIKKKNSNNCIGKYNIIPLVLPFIGVKQDEKKNKMI